DHSVDRGSQTAVVDFTVQLRDLRLRSANGSTDRRLLCAGRCNGGIARANTRLLLIDDLTAHETVFEQRLGTTEFLLGEQLLAQA
ncbi:hypothetical protein SB776_36910, partial [Burkholderia sp. SIMBA_045]